VVETDHNENMQGVRIVGAAKLIYGFLLGVVVLGALHLISKDAGADLDGFVDALHLDPENHMSKATLHLAGLNQRHVEAFGAGTLLFALLEMIEGAGLYMRRHWAAYLTVVTTGILLLPECYELAQKISASRSIIFAINLALVLYLIYQLRQNRQ